MADGQQQVQVGDTVYVTKYALTEGIQPITVKLVSVICARVLVTDSPYWSYSYYMNKEAFSTLDEALAAAETMRLKKIKSLQKQIATLQTLKIKVKEKKDDI